MARTTQTVPLGPWPGGVNNKVPANEIADDELAGCVDFDYTPDGWLVSRPPIMNSKYVDSERQSDLLALWKPDRYNIYPVWASASKIVRKLTLNSPGSAGSAIMHTAPSGRYECALQYNGYIYCFWNGYNGTTAGVTHVGNTSESIYSLPGLVQPNNGMPHGVTAALYKDRIFVGVGKYIAAESSRIYFSTVGVASWNTADYIDVFPNDGQHITAIVNFNGGLYIFKNNSTYLYTYESNPGLGSILPISTVIGASSSHSVCTKDSVLYTGHESKLYAIQGTTFSLLNPKTDLQVYPRYQAAVYLTFNQYGKIFGGYQAYPEHISVLGHRIMYGCNGSYWAYDTRTGNWAIWHPYPTVGRWFKYSSDEYIAGRNAGYDLASQVAFWFFKDSYDFLPTMQAMEIRPQIYTKVHAFGSSDSWKAFDRVNIRSKGRCKSYSLSVKLVSDTKTKTWDSLATKTWDSLSNSRWYSPSDVVENTAYRDITYSLTNPTVLYSSVADNIHTKISLNKRGKALRLFLNFQTARDYDSVTHVPFKATRLEDLTVTLRVGQNPVSTNTGL